MNHSRIIGLFILGIALGVLGSATLRSCSKPPQTPPQCGVRVYVCYDSTSRCDVHIAACRPTEEPLR